MWVTHWPTFALTSMEVNNQHLYMHIKLCNHSSTIIYLSRLNVFSPKRFSFYTHGWHAYKIWYARRQTDRQTNTADRHAHHKISFPTGGGLIICKRRPFSEIRNTLLNETGYTMLNTLNEACDTFSYSFHGPSNASFPSSLQHYQAANSSASDSLDSCD